MTKGGELKAVRNTPTGVGKTQKRHQLNLHSRKHPHGRGEDAMQRCKELLKKETPPRAWGRLKAILKNSAGTGNTPTGVGKTVLNTFSCLTPRKHHHGRGEDRIQRGFFLRWEETPPRAWGRLYLRCEYTNELGNTPTGVGKTQEKLKYGLSTKKHPHGRGEDNAQA